MLAFAAPVPVDAAPLPVAADQPAACPPTSATWPRHPHHDGDEYPAAVKALAEADFQRRLAAHPVDIDAIRAVTIPLYIHVIAKDESRAGGNIPDSMIKEQVKVLNDSYAGKTGGHATPFQF